MKNTYSMAIVTEPGKIEFREFTLPRLGEHDVLIKVKAASICGSDLHIYKGKHPAAPLPIAIGHEVSGEITRVGKCVSKVKKGDRVAVEPVIVCGKCDFCKRGQYHLCTDISFQYRKGQGCFTPYFIVDENWVHKIPEELSFEEGALLEPLSVAIHAVNKANIRLGQTCAIFGAGAIGLLILMLSKLSGAGETIVVDVKDYRLEKAKELGACHVLNNMDEDVIERILGQTCQMGVDTAYEAVGLEITLVQALKAVRKGGMTIIVGLFESQELKLPANILVQKEIVLAGSQGYCWDFQTALKVTGQGNLNLKSLITHTFPLSSLQDAFECLMDPENQALKVIIKVD